MIALSASLLSALVATLLQTQQQPSSVDTVSPLPDWLIGCWETEDGTREVWSKPHPDIMFGYNVTVSDGAVSFFEQLRIQRTTDGLVYAAYPGGTGPTFFLQFPVADGTLAFFNPQNESPQVIQYLAQDGMIIAGTMQLDGTDAKRWTFTKCTGED